MIFWSCQSLEDVLSAVTSPKPVLKKDTDERSYAYEVSWPFHPIFIVVFLQLISTTISVSIGLVNFP